MDITQEGMPNKTSLLIGNPGPQLLPPAALELNPPSQRKGTTKLATPVRVQILPMIGRSADRKENKSTMLKEKNLQKSNK